MTRLGAGLASIALAAAAAAADSVPIAPMREETRALVRAEWARFSAIPGTLHSFNNGHGMLVFHGEPKTPPAHPSARAAVVDGILFFQCPTRRAALSFARFLDAERRDLGAERSDGLHFHVAAPGGAIDGAIEQVCNAAPRDLGYVAAPPTITSTGWRDVRIGEPLPEKIPACVELTPKRHAELLAASESHCQHAAPGATAVSVYAPSAAGERAWRQTAVVLMRERKVAGVYEFLGPHEVDGMIEMAVRSFGLPTTTRSSPATDQRMRRELYWIGEQQVVVFMNLERAFPGGGSYSVIGYVSREQFEISRAQPPQ